MVLVPTIRELRQLRAHGLPLADGFLCGFGPVAAAARAAALIATHRPERVVLIGIAGTYNPERLPIAHAASFTEIAIDGIGAGEGDLFLGPAEMRIPQWQGEGTDDGDAIHQRLSIAGTASSEGALLTVCAASATPEQARRRMARFHDVVAEDMEAFAVAFACVLARVPLTVIRGISNVAGDREASGWRVADALKAAALRFRELAG